MVGCFDDVCDEVGREVDVRFGPVPGVKGNGSRLKKTRSHERRYAMESGVVHFV